MYNKNLSARLNPGRSIRPRRLLASLLVVLVLLAPNQTPAAKNQSERPVEISWQRLEELLEHRTFKSQEELFQLLFLLYAREEPQAIRLGEEVIARLAREIKTLFPLAGCQTIELEEGRIVFEFAGDQDVAIPNTWRQASLTMPKKLVLRVTEVLPAATAGKRPGPSSRPEDTQGRSIRFSVEQGFLQLHFSFLLKIFGGKLRDAEGSELVYQLDDARKTSRLQLIEVTPLAGNSLKIAHLPAADKEPKTLWIDILHPDFPGARDIGISERTVSFLGTEVELLPDQTIRIGGGKPQKNEEAWKWFADNILLFREYARGGELATHIDYARNFGYHFEERQIVMNMGFRASTKVD